MSWLDNSFLRLSSASANASAAFSFRPGKVVRLSTAFSTLRQELSGVALFIFRTSDYLGYDLSFFNQAEPNYVVPVRHPFISVFT